MTPRRTLSLLIAPAVAALALAGCGASGSDSSSGGSGGLYGGGAPPASAAPASTGARVAVAHGHLVDGTGRTLYLFLADRSGRSVCAGECASDWPPATTTGTPRAGHGVKAALIRVAKRADGTSQLTYRGHPLYRFSGDAAAGQANGQGLDEFGALWWEVTPAGAALRTAR